ncbi:MAG: siderophore-interacting protein [Pseudomonadota bacterium]
MAGIYQLTVVSNESLTPSMRRVVLTGSDLESFPAAQESGYVKLELTDAEGSRVMRSYTIRAFDPQTQRLLLDFVDHGDAGPASAWARHVQPGESITIRGPGEPKRVDPSADWFLIAGDLSALPAIAANLEGLRRDAQGYVFIEIPDPADQQSIDAPPGMTVRWILNADPTCPNKPLLEALEAQAWLPGTPYPWFAGEFEGMRRARRYLRDQRGIDKRAMYLSCYWKLGDTDEGMKRAKRADAEADSRTPA